MKLTPEEHIKIIKEIALSKGGKLISKIYLGGRVKLKFKDAAGNIFNTAPEQIKSGTWSPYEGQISEPAFRQAMNHLFSTIFEKTKNVLTSEKLNRTHALELDGYCSNLKVAFEYQGYPSHWRQTHRNYETTIIRDAIKKQFCEENGIDLIIIPAIKPSKDSWTSENILKMTIDAIKNFYLSNNKICPQLNSNIFKLDLSKNNHCLKMLNRMREIAIANNGKLLTKKWRGTKNKYHFIDSSGIKFSIVGANLLNKDRGWPKDIVALSKTNKQCLEELRSLAEINGGTLLSKKWFGSDASYSFLFTDGRKFSQKASEIKSRGWPKGISKLFNSPTDYFKEIKELAKISDFKILDKKWLGNDIKHRFLSSCGREISMTPNKIKTEGFIKDLDLYFKTPLEYLDDIRKIAEANDGQLLETEWLGNEVAHRFKFKDGREFTLKPHHLKSQGWPQNANNYFSQIAVVGMSDEDKLQRIRKIAEDNNGQLLESSWLGYNKKHRFLFSDGRPFSTTSDILTTKGWPKGVSSLFFSGSDYLNELKEIAEKNNGKLLTSTWSGNRSKYEFQFQDGRRFYMQPASLKNRGWPKNADSYFKSKKVKYSVT